MRCRLAAAVLALAWLAWLALPAPARRAHPETAVPDDTLAVMAEARTDEKLCCLTFDDGPSPHTGALAETLAEYGAKATFFVTAQPANTDYLPALGELAAAGHQIALHSASHDYARIYASPEAFWLDIKALRQALAPWVEVEGLCWLRFPGGSTNTVSHRYGGSQIMTRLKEQAEERGYHSIDWNVSAEDAAGGHPDAQAILRNIVKDAKDRNVCVVLMHDTKATDTTVEALPDIISWFKENGYQFCTVADLPQ